MANSRQPLIILAVMVVIGITAFVANTMYRDSLRDNSEPAQDLLINSIRSDFSYKDLDGFTRHLSEWDGQIIVLNFWASWCGPCLREIPALVALQQANEDVQVIGLALDDRVPVEAFIESLSVEINYPILIGGDDAKQTVLGFGNNVGILPYTVFIDSSSRIAFVQYGEITQASAENLIEQLR